MFRDSTKTQANQHKYAGGRQHQRIGNAILLTRTLWIDGFEIETDGAETVVAGDHGAAGILHPAVEEIAAPAGKLFDEFPHAPPRAIAEAFRLEPVTGNENLPLAHVTRVLDGVFIKHGKILIAGLPHNGDLYIHKTRRL